VGLEVGPVSSLTIRKKSTAIFKRVTEFADPVHDFTDKPINRKTTLMARWIDRDTALENSRRAAAIRLKSSGGF
jgi:hypothetical protein